MSNFIKICPEAVEFHAIGHTDRHDVGNSRFSRFCERAKRSVIPPVTRLILVIVL
jgi:hypothetical protein